MKLWLGKYRRARNIRLFWEEMLALNRILVNFKKPRACILMNINQCIPATQGTTLEACG